MHMIHSHPEHAPARPKSALQIANALVGETDLTKVRNEYQQSIDQWKKYVGTLVEGEDPIVNSLGQMWDGEVERATFDATGIRGRMYDAMAGWQNIAEIVEMRNGSAVVSLKQ